jgi:hypothetical protein
MASTTPTPTEGAGCLPAILALVGLIGGAVARMLTAGGSDDE